MNFDQSRYDYREFIRGAFVLRSRRNVKYSLRAYARDLGLSASTLSEVMNGRYGLSSARAQQVAQRLGLSTEEAAYFSALVELSHARTEESREQVQIKIEHLKVSKFVAMDSDQFRFVADWYHMAILEMFGLKGFNASVGKISRKLKIPLVVAEEALQRLQRVGLLSLTESGSLQATEDFTQVSSQVPSSAIRSFHQQIIEKATAALEKQPLEHREVSSTVFAIAKKDLPEAKKQLQAWRQKFAHDLSQSENKDDVYCLSMQFFSLLNDEGSL